jgi:hypothetical protein
VPLKRNVQADNAPERDNRCCPSVWTLEGGPFRESHEKEELVNVPYVEAVVREMVRLARPGGVIACHEAAVLFRERDRQPWCWPIREKSKSRRCACSM